MLGVKDCNAIKQLIWKLVGHCQMKPKSPRFVEIVGNRGRYKALEFISNELQTDYKCCDDELDAAVPSPTKVGKLGARGDRTVKTSRHIDIDEISSMIERFNDKG